MEIRPQIRPIGPIGPAGRSGPAPKLPQPTKTPIAAPDGYSSHDGVRFVLPASDRGHSGTWDAATRTPNKGRVQRPGRAKVPYAGGKNKSGFPFSKPHRSGKTGGSRSSFGIGQDGTQSPKSESSPLSDRIKKLKKEYQGVRAMLSIVLWEKIESARGSDVAPRAAGAPTLEGLFSELSRLGEKISDLVNRSHPMTSEQEAMVGEIRDLEYWFSLWDEKSKVLAVMPWEEGYNHSVLAMESYTELMPITGELTRIIQTLRVLHEEEEIAEPHIPFITSLQRHFLEVIDDLYLLMEKVDGYQKSTSLSFQQSKDLDLYKEVLLAFIQTHQKLLGIVLHFTQPTT